MQEPTKKNWAKPKSLMSRKNKKVMEIIKAVTKQGSYVSFNRDTRNWEYLDKNLSEQETSLKTEDMKSFVTNNGEISFAELKAIYFSKTQNDEINKMVDEIYANSKKCDCTVCSWPSHCKWGSDCSFQKNVPCNWCCPD